MFSRALVVTVLLCSSVCLAVDWPQWRGPQRDNLCSEEGLLQSWPQRGPVLLWQATGLGQGHSSPVIVKEMLYTTGESNGTSYVHALKLGESKPMWSVPIGKAGAPGWGGFTGPRSTPTVDGNRLYVMGQYGELVCVDIEQGTLLWQRHLEPDFGGKMPEWGYSESVLIDGERLLCTPGGNQGLMVALNKQDGSLLWQTSGCTDTAHYSSIIKAEIEGIPQYIQLTADSVLGVALDGTILWRAVCKGKTAVIPTPVVMGNLVYVTSGYGVGCHCFKVVRSGEAFAVEQVYAERSMANQIGGVVLLDGKIYGYCDRKGWLCQDVTTGEVLWSSKDVGKGTLLYADGCLYLRSEKGGDLALIKATPDGFQQQGHFTQPDLGKGQTWSSLVIANKRLYVRDQDQILCYDIAVP